MTMMLGLALLLWLLTAAMLIWSTRRLEKKIRWIFIGIAILLLPATLLLYQHIGSPRPLPMANMQAPQVTPPDIDKMIAGLEQRLSVDTHDVEGLKMLARSYRVKGQYQKSIDRYHQILTIEPSNTDMMLALVEVIMLRDDEQIGPAAKYWIQQVLKREPLQPQALWLAGLEARQQNDNKQALSYWNKLLPLLDGKPQQQQLTDLIAQLQQK